MNFQIGTVKVATTDRSGHDVEFYADRMVERMISVSENAPEPIKAQALIFKDSLRKIVLDGLKRAIRSDRTTLANELNMCGLGEASSYLARRDI